MKLTRMVFALALICFAANFVFSQKKDEKSPSPVEIKANVNVLDAAGNFVGDIKQEDLKIFEDGTEQKITYFAKKEPVLNIGLVIDNTGSLRTRLGIILDAGKAIAANLSPSDEAFIVRFVSSDKISVEQEWTSNKSQMNNALENMYIEGGQSAIIDALYLSANKILEREKKEKARRYALVLITDGEDRDSYYKLNAMLSLIDKTDVQIFVIALTEELSDKKNALTKVRGAKTNAEKLAGTLALETGGTAYISGEKSSVKDLVSAINAIAAELRSPYVVGYTSTNQKRDGLARKLTIQVADNAKGEKRQGVIRENFVVPKD